MDRPASIDAPGCDTSDMRLIHTLFRMVFGDAPKLVRSVAAGDVQRARIVGDHLIEICGGLHNHHHGEDTLLWDQLASRSPGCAVHVDLMKRQHAEIAKSVSSAEKATVAWQATASAEDASVLLAALDDINRGLGIHLGDEEDQILPEAGRVLTQREWNRLGEHGRSLIPRNRMFIQLGFILDTMPSDVAHAFLKESLPAPARLLFHLVGRRQYLAHRRAVYGALA